MAAPSIDDDRPRTDDDDERVETPYIDIDDLYDSLKMPERAIHRQTVDLMALAATRLLGDEVWIFRDLNWYPTDGGNATAPDIMVLPRDTLDELPTSYRQDRTDGPAPLAAVEVASNDDSFIKVRLKARRAQNLGTPFYLVIVEGEQAILRLGLDDAELTSWTGKPIDELGGIALDFADGLPVLTLPDGTTASSDADLVGAAEEKVRALEAQLRQLGAEPDAD